MRANNEFAQKTEASNSSNREVPKHRFDYQIESFAHSSLQQTNTRTAVLQPLHISILKEIIFIPAVSHSTVNYLCAHRLTYFDEATTSTKSRDNVLQSPNQTPLGPQLCLELLFMKMMTQTGNHPHQRPTCTRGQWRGHHKTSLDSA